MDGRSALFLGVCALTVAGFIGAAAAEQGASEQDAAKEAPVADVVYLVLMAGSPPLHLIEMPSMEKCQAAVRHTSNAKCVVTQAVGVKDLKSKAGGVGRLTRLPAKTAPRPLPPKE
ncbi:MAG: hypothetical protein A3G18_09070 [Rhodospirillales bacterium RIFCSPLOWO2_12_FULL_58_28]|nr:MAG: hypothetical protein A3H92_10800 [Rhodospirillales bacterium RIFCSPLOWO2_02_FULL_58_16]OHC79211.1 MAG: hypothetical protein A3G18_09070 [Rhodospirillales bacterium RIFCSPLOWO2_12_FULL_58_28]